MRMTQLNGLAALTVLTFGALAAGCHAEPIEATGKNTVPLGDGVCKTHDEIPPPSINAPNGGACPAVGSDCSKSGPPESLWNLCVDGARRMVLTCDAATKTWQVQFKECGADAGAPTSSGSSPAMCKLRDEIPPPSIDAPNGGACPAVGSDCSKSRPPESLWNLCVDGARRMVLTCDTATKTWQVLFKECTAAGAAPPTTSGATPDAAAPSSDGASMAMCKARDEIPAPFGDPVAGVGPDGVCEPEGTACTFPVALCTDKQGRRIYMECDKTTHTWRIVFKECP